MKNHIYNTQLKDYYVVDNSKLIQAIPLKLQQKMTMKEIKIAPMKETESLSNQQQ